jgi:PucR C-terminal helix-turn-helix domain/GGDEF-like domain
VRKVERAAGLLAASAVTRMEERLPWYRAMGAEERSWVGLVIQAGIASFVAWFRAGPEDGSAITADVFGTAPRELTRSISLQQTVELVKAAVDVVDENVEAMVSPAEAPLVQMAVLRYSRDVAFAAAQVYAAAAETRGAWDARLEALVVDSLLRGEAGDQLRSRAAALGWESAADVCVVVGQVPGGDSSATLDALRDDARRAGLDLLIGVQGERLVVVLGGVRDARSASGLVAPRFGPGAVVAGPVVPDLLAASVSARSAVSGLRASAAWAAAPRPVLAEDLLPERALAGDGHARRALVGDVHAPLAAAGPVVLDTVEAFLASGGSVEATARALFVHPNTVRYRLKRATEVAGRSPFDPRDAYVLRLALTLGRLVAPS